MEVKHAKTHGDLTWTEYYLKYISKHSISVKNIY